MIAYGIILSVQGTTTAALYGHAAAGVPLWCGLLVSECSLYFSFVKMHINNIIHVYLISSLIYYLFIKLFIYVVCLFV